MENKAHPSHLVLVISVLLLTGAAGPAVNSQENEKALKIERYQNEPLQLVEIRIGDQSVNAELATKPIVTSERLDTITFKQTAGWYRHLEIRLRNVSGKLINGIRASLYFHPVHTEAIFSVPFSAFSPSGNGILEPGAETTLIITEQAWILSEDILKRHLVDPEQSPAFFGLATVSFDRSLEWSKGQMLRRDPDNPNRWTVIPN